MKLTDIKHYNKDTKLITIEQNNLNSGNPKQVAKNIGTRKHHGRGRRQTSG